MANNPFQAHHEADCREMARHSGSSRLSRYHPSTSIVRDARGELFARTEQDTSNFLRDFLWFVGERRFDVVACIPSWDVYSTMMTGESPRWPAMLSSLVDLGCQVRILVEHQACDLLPATGLSPIENDELVFAEEAPSDKPLLHIRRAKSESVSESFSFWLGHHSLKSAESAGGEWALWTPTLTPMPEAKTGSIASMLSINGKSAIKLGRSLLDSFNTAFRLATESHTENVTLVAAVLARQAWPV